MFNLANKYSLHLSVCLSACVDELSRWWSAVLAVASHWLCVCLYISLYVQPYAWYLS